ncbi:MAG: NAD-dependent epimerase/dehydratase family protein [Gaiellaceae bacterium]
MSIAVIGSQGFIGRALVATLREDDLAVVEFPSTRPFLRADRSPADQLAAADAVVYLASRINPGIAERDPAAADAHLAALGNLLRALAGSGKRVIYPSSGGTVYDTKRKPPYGETSPLRPIGRFGATKVEAERLLSETPGIEPVAMRISNAYGPGQQSGTGLGVIAHWLAAAAEGEPLRMIGPPETTRDFVYVDDVGDAILRALSSDTPPPIVNIASGTPTSLGELAEIVQAVIPGIEFVLEPNRSFDVARSWLDIGLARETLGWAPTTELREGIARTWDYNVRYLAPQASR